MARQSVPQSIWRMKQRTKLLPVVPLDLAPPAYPMLTRVLFTVRSLKLTI